MHKLSKTQTVNFKGEEYVIKNVFVVKSQTEEGLPILTWDGYEISTDKNDEPYHFSLTGECGCKGFYHRRTCRHQTIIAIAIETDEMQEVKAAILPTPKLSLSQQTDALDRMMTGSLGNVPKIRVEETFKQSLAKPASSDPFVVFEL